MDDLVFEKAKLIRRDFTGRGSKWMPPGLRTFCIDLDFLKADQLASVGWKIQGSIANPWMLVRLPKVRPAYITVLVNNVAHLLAEDAYWILDGKNELITNNVIIEPRAWEVDLPSGTRAGVAALLKSMEIRVSNTTKEH